MPWVMVFIAGCFEVVFAISLKNSDGFSHLRPTIVAFIAGGISFVLLTFAMRHLAPGTAYAVWTGIGAAGTVLVGLVALGEPANPGRLVSISFVIAGIIGLKLAEK